MLEIAVCDDDIADLNNAVVIIDKILSEYNIQYNIRTFLSANKLLNNTYRIDIGILDISMKELSGITLGRKLKEKFHDIKLIYTTSYRDYIVQVINEVHAFSFLCKPIDTEVMKKQIMEAFSQISDREIERDFEILDKSGTKYNTVRLKLGEILYFEYIKRSRKAAIILADKRYECKCVFEQLIQELQPYDFAVNCRGNLVNLNHVERIKGFIVYLDNGKELQIAQRRMIEFKEKMNEFLQKKS